MANNDRKDKPTNRKKAIRMKCMDCSCGQYAEVRNCTVTSCPLWEFRMGNDPYHTRKRKEEEEEDDNDEESSRSD